MQVCHGPYNNNNSQNKNQYRMPAEWEKQKSTWIAWPHNERDWPGKFHKIPMVFSKIVAELSKVQLVNILVKSKSDKKRIIFFLETFCILFSITRRRFT